MATRVTHGVGTANTTADSGRHERRGILGEEAYLWTISMSRFDTSGNRCDRTSTTEPG